MPQLGRAVPITCPGCGIGQITGQCTRTPAAEHPAPGSLGPVETVYCETCGLWIRNGLLEARGVDLRPDDVREIARLHAPNADPESWYMVPEARPVRLMPTTVETSGLAGFRWPEISSVTIHFVRPRPAERNAR